MKPVRFTALVACTLVWGCAPEDYWNYEASDGGSTVASSLTVRVTSLNADDPRPMVSAGHNPATQLLSLKYYIRSLLICEQIETEGSAFHDPEGCLEIYRGHTDIDFEYGDPNQDFSAQADLARLDDEGFVDIVNSEGRASLGSTRTLGPEAIGSYDWGVVTWYMPFKITAEVPLGDDVVLRTHDGDTRSTATNGGYTYTTVAPGSFADGRPAEEAVVLHPHGGSWFRFQNPFRITAADIDAGEQFNLDLTFNAEGVAKGYTWMEAPMILKDNAGHGLAVAMLDLTPVPRPEGSAVRVESYRASVTGVSSVAGGLEDHFDLRLDLYSIDDDPDETIYGATLTTLVNESTTSVVPTAPKVAFVVEEEHGSLSFEDWSHTAILSGFIRQMETGAQTDVWVSCSDTGFRFAGCADQVESTTGQMVSFELDVVRTLP